MSPIPQRIEAERNSLVQYTPASNIPFQPELRLAFQHASMSRGDTTYTERRELVHGLEGMTPAYGCMDGNSKLDHKSCISK